MTASRPSTAPLTTITTWRAGDLRGTFQVCLAPAAEARARVTELLYGRNLIADPQAKRRTPKHPGYARASNRRLDQPAH